MSENLLWYYSLSSYRQLLCCFLRTLNIALLVCLLMHAVQTDSAVKSKQSIAINITCIQVTLAPSNPSQCPEVCWSKPTVQSKFQLQPFKVLSSNKYFILAEQNLKAQEKSSNSNFINELWSVSAWVKSVFEIT